MKQVKSPKLSFARIDSDAAAKLVVGAADVALLMDREGVIRDVAFGSEDLAQENQTNWVDRPWADTVTIESRPKIAALLSEVTSEALSRRRHVNHASENGDLPILYSALKVGPDGGVVAVGRDLRAMAAVQQKLVGAQQAMQRDYARLRHVESRYRTLFQTATEAVLIVDGNSDKVLEVNPASAELMGEIAKRVVGRAFPDCFDKRGVESVKTLLAGVRAAGRADDARARLEANGREFVISAVLLRQDDDSLFLVRLRPVQIEEHATFEGAPVLAKLAKVIEAAPDAFVITSAEGRITSANKSFLDMAQLTTEEQTRGESLERWLGRPGVDLNVLIANLRQHGTVRLFATQLRGEFGANADVEISAVSVLSGEQTPNFGFVIRNVAQRLGPDARVGRPPRSVEQLTELVGRVSLKDLVREATDVIERLCIEAALELTGDNRASAAEMLGLSRQSLYVKLRRYGLGDLASESEE